MKSSPTLLCAGIFELTVLGKNGVTIDGVLFTPNSSPAPLASKVRLCSAADFTCDSVVTQDAELYWLHQSRGGCCAPSAGPALTVKLESFPAAAGKQVLLAMGDRQFYFLLPKQHGKPRARAKCACVLCSFAATVQSQDSYLLPARCLLPPNSICCGRWIKLRIRE